MGDVKVSKGKPDPAMKNPFLKKPVRLISEELENARTTNAKEAFRVMAKPTKKEAPKPKGKKGKK
jgi:hypothetical protein